jgi:alpha-glucuronidase
VDTWQGLQTSIDDRRHRHVSKRLAQQFDNAREWREVCLNYFGQFASRENS